MECRVVRSWVVAGLQMLTDVNAHVDAPAALSPDDSFRFVEARDELADTGSFTVAS
jgi:hypothetical protein